MFLWLYRQPIIFVIIFIYASIALWAVGIHFGIKNLKSLRNWTRFNLIFLIASVLFILYATLFTRSEDYIRILHLQPFRLFEIAKTNPEMYRSMLMNVALFLPFGVSCSSLFQQKTSIVKVLFLTSLLGFTCSVIIEALQYAFYLGETEFDDVMCNTFGAFLGAFAPLLQWLYVQNKKQEK